MPLRERCAKLQRLRDVIFESRDEIAWVITRETGKPRIEAIFAEILLALDTADFLARRAPRWLRPERVPHHNIALKAKSAWLEFEPYGVIAIISPWNFPFAIPLAQLIPALCRERGAAEALRADALDGRSDRRTITTREVSPESSASPARAPETSAPPSSKPAPTR